VIPEREKSDSIYHMKKKKNLVYFVAPLAGLAVFAGIYMNYAGEYQAKIDNAAAKIRKDREEKIATENILKKKAVEEALIAQAARKKAKEEKEAKDLEERDRRERAQIAMATARDTANRKVAEVRRLEKQVEDTKREIAKMEQEKKSYVDEQVFIKQYVQKAEANHNQLKAVLQKIEAADRAYEEAARAAAAAAAAAAKSKK
jgi:predicted RNase H-like nuclease (RuvC/YqgF family)